MNIAMYVALGVIFIGAVLEGLASGFGWGHYLAISIVGIAVLLNMFYRQK